MKWSKFTDEQILAIFREGEAGRATRDRTWYAEPAFLNPPAVLRAA